MTPEEMMADLRQRGYRVEAPIKSIAISGDAKITLSDGREIKVVAGETVTFHFDPSVEIRGGTVRYD